MSGTGRRPGRGRARTAGATVSGKPETAIGGTAEGEAATGAACPLCGRPALLRYRPFCSTRCANLDLFRWLGGSYRIATDEEPDPGEPLPPRDEER